MKKLLLSALLLAGTMLTATAENVLIGESQRDPSIYAYDGLSNESEANIGIALRIPARTLQAYPGAKIVSLKIAAADQCNEQPITYFLAKGALSNGQLTLGDYICKDKGYMSWTPISTMQGSWDYAPFDKPYTIPEAKDVKFDLYFGIYTHAQANQRVVGTSAYTQQVGKNKVYLSLSGADGEAEPQNWVDIYSIPTIYNNNVCICAVLELPSETNTNAMSINASYAPSFGILDQPTTAYIYLSNDGPTEIKNFELTTTFNDEAESVQVYSFPEDEPMPIGYAAQNRQGMPIPLPVMGSGIHKMTVTKVNGEENLADPESSTVSFDIIGIPQEEADKYRRRPVVEQYCAEDDHKSGVYQDDIVLPSLEPYKNYCTFLPQHSNDKYGQNPQDIPAFVDGKETIFTLTDADRLFIGLVGDINQVMIPSQTIDRSIQMQEIVLAGKTESTVTATLYPQAMIYYMNEALSVPTCATVTLSNTFNTATRNLHIEATGSVADVMPAGEQAHLALYLIEENVESDSQEFPDDESVATKYPDGKLIHTRVVRQMVTPIEGDALDAGEFTKEYDVEIDNTRWNAENMKVIALIQRPMTNDRLSRNIINSAEEGLTIINKPGSDPVQPGDDDINTFNYGFCPEDVTEEESIGLGSGKNNDLEVMIRLSPSEMPQVAALKGAKIMGIRAKLRNDVERKATVISRIGSLKAEATKKACWLNEGWNEIKFDDPIVIGDEDIYVGYRAYETQGCGNHPVVSASTPAPSATGYVNINLSGWQDAGSKGAVMIQAMIDGDKTILDAPAATATVTDFPQLVAPAAPFQATVTIKNLSAKPVSSLTVDYGHGAVDVEEEIAPFGVKQSIVTLMTDEVESTDRAFVSSVSKINGQDVDGYKSTTHLYVTRDVFTRIPLIEEWTGQTCPNCPFMAYYLDEAREVYGKPHTYVAHHDGFAKDKMTQPVDTELLFLFGDPKNQSNPAIMYDRSYLPGETQIIFNAAGEIGPRQYLERMVAAELIPALAEVNVSIDGQDVTVKGKVSTGSKTQDGKVFISAYLVEDDIKPTIDYLPQLGVNAQVADDAPADMVEKFRHNGVIRANLTEVSTGDRFNFDADGNYEVHFTLPEFKDDWKAENMHVVSFIHRFNPENMGDNYVLNSGDSAPIAESSLREISLEKASMKAVRGKDGKIIILTPIVSAEAFDLQGRKLNLNEPSKGLVIIRATLPDGQKATAKIK